MPFIHLSETRLHELANENHAMEDFAGVLAREAIAINSKVETHSVRSAIERDNLSWSTVEDQSKEFLVERFKAIENLDEDQRIALFDQIYAMTLKQPARKRRDYVFKIINGFYLKWIIECMYSTYS